MSLKEEEGVEGEGQQRPAEKTFYSPKFSPGLIRHTQLLESGGRGGAPPMGGPGGKGGAAPGGGGGADPPPYIKGVGCCHVP